MRLPFKIFIIVRLSIWLLIQIFYSAIHKLTQNMFITHWIISNVTQQFFVIYIRKTFESVSHGILLHQLNNYVIWGMANQIIWVVGNNIKFSIMFHLSLNKSIMGSILRPLLFMMHVNDMIHLSCYEICCLAMVQHLF